MTFDISIKTSEEAQRLNRIAEKQPYDIWIHGKSGYADAKSLLGIMILTIENNVKLVVEDDIDTRQLEAEIAEFLVYRQSKGN